MSNTRLHLLFIVFLGFLVYSNTLQAPFVLDDEPWIVNNPALRDFSYFTDPAKTEGMKTYRGFQDIFNSRKAGMLTFLLNYRIGGLNVMGYHLFNISIHLLNALLLYCLLRLTFSLPCFAGAGGRSRAPAALTALFCSLFFVCHPVQTQAVTYLIQRFASLTTLFYLASVVCYVRARASADKLFVTPSWYACALISAVLAMKTKEIAITLPVMLALYEFIFLEGPKGRRLGYLLPFFLTALMVPLGLLGHADSASDKTGALDAVAMGTNSRADYLLTQFRVIVTYLRLLIFPFGQNFDYDYPIFRSLSAYPVFLSFLFLSALFAAAAILLIKAKETAGGAYRLSAFGILWFFVTLSVESSLIPLENVIFEHRLYLPFSGFIIALSPVILSATAKPAGKAVPALLILALALHSTAAYSRNAIWTDKITLWADAVSKSPAKPRPLNNLASEYIRKGSFDQALKILEPGVKTVDRVKDRFVSADMYANLGVVYMNMQRQDNAVTSLKEALTIFPYHASARHNLGLIYLDRGQLMEAEKELTAAVVLNPSEPNFRYYLASACERQGKFDEAYAEYRKAFGLNPKLAETYNNQGVDHYKRREFNEAVRVYRFLIELNPRMVQPHYNLGLALKELSAYREAADEFRTSLKLMPNLDRAHYNLGLILIREGKPAEAASEFEAALKLNPGNNEAKKELDRSRTGKI